MCQWRKHRIVHSIYYRVWYRLRRNYENGPHTIWFVPHFASEVSKWIPKRFGFYFKIGLNRTGHGLRGGVHLIGPSFSFPRRQALREWLTFVRKSIRSDPDPSRFQPRICERSQAEPSANSNFTICFEYASAITCSAGRLGLRSGDKIVERKKNCSTATMSFLDTFIYIFLRLFSARFSSLLFVHFI